MRADGRIKKSKLDHYQRDDLIARLERAANDPITFGYGGLVDVLREAAAALTAQVGTATLVVTGRGKPVVHFEIPEVPQPKGSE